MSRLNSEFNYRTQVIGETTWAKIQTLKGFLAGRKRAAGLKECARLKIEALKAEVEFAKANNSPAHILLRLQSDLLEQEAGYIESLEYYVENDREIVCLEKILAELYEIAEPTRIAGYDDDMMFEENAEDEFVACIAKDALAEVAVHGTVLVATLRNAMRSEKAFNTLKLMKIIPETAQNLIVENTTLKLTNAAQS